MTNKLSYYIILSWVKMMKNIFNELAVKYVGYVSVLLDFNRDELIKLNNMNNDEATELLQKLYLKKQEEQKEKEPVQKKYQNPHAYIGYGDF